MPPLRGVVHAAGVLRDAVLTNQRWNDAREVLRGKVHGAWLLHTLTQDLPLDFFILYSAAGVVLGAPGQGLYPAANAELDALARFRRRLGLKALSVAWGTMVRRRNGVRSGGTRTGRLEGAGAAGDRCRGGFCPTAAPAGGSDAIWRCDSNRLAALPSATAIRSRSRFLRRRWRPQRACSPRDLTIRPRLSTVAGAFAGNAVGSSPSVAPSASDGSGAGVCLSSTVPPRSARRFR